MLLEASKASRSWRERTLDSRLWKQKFTGEGWGLNMNEVARFEKGDIEAAVRSKPNSRRADHPAEQRLQKRRARTNGAVDLVDTSPLSSQAGPERGTDAQSWNDQYSTVEADTEEELTVTKRGDDQEMQDGELQLAQYSKREARYSLDRMDTNGSHESQDSTAQADHLRISSITNEIGQVSNRSKRAIYDNDISMWTSSATGHPKVNFHQVYKQKRKLEENWISGRYKSFQLPHRDYPEEAHIECVYTIQYGTNHLVSGSRDKTLRIWNLETQRLVRKPLVGHTGSVLCLQFDDRESEDIIISGSSDTDVILWRFSTGKMIKKIAHAHRESVLNLKFDDRFLVTCSKDKTIKIWNRHELRPGDKNYPVKGVSGGGKCPAYILDLSSYTSPMDIEQHLTPKQRQPLARYNTIMTLDTHGAAVNAIYIYKDQLVSASGDRSLKVWNIHNGVCTAMCMGHTKGIACVQYDGKRIVSGSSDNTIRIFDPRTQAEVACLQGHSRLVRTIQAAFADPQGTAEDLEEEARAVDRTYFEARRSGTIPSSSARLHRNRDRNAGSRQPRDILVYGAKIPPGGGGNRWSRIVSGSYDETVIVWKKASDGRWVVSYRLRQAEALRAAGGQLIAQSELQHQAQQQAISQQQHPHGPLVLPQNAQTFPPQAQNLQHIQHPMPAHQVVQHAMHNGAAAFQAGINNLTAMNHQLGNHTNVPNAPPLYFHGIGGSHLIQQQLQATAQVQAQLLNQHQQQVQQQQPQTQQQQAQPPPQLQPQLQAQPLPQQQQNAPQQLHPQHAAMMVNAVPQPNARVFKLQFDARRIICCSQDPKIVGWDFANGDEEIIECSKFFGIPS